MRRPTRIATSAARASAGRPAGGSLSDLFFRQCRAGRGTTAYAFINNDLDAVDETTFAQLERDVVTLARGLAAEVDRGERVLLALGNGLDTVRLFWACIVAGAVPIPAPPPDTRHSKVNLARLNAIAANAEAVLAVTSQDQWSDDLTRDSELRWTTPAELLAAEGIDVDDRAASEDDVAYLQYTSGSTATPRGVILTHGNVLAQCRALSAVAAPVPENVERRALTWLPWYHDYGLVHGVIGPMHEGSASYLMATLNFLRHPLRWLEAIAHLKITHSGAPDFAYAACAAAVARQPKWSAPLGSWLVASCGAEPVKASTVAAFTGAFAPHGFRPAAFSPAYGLGEAVLVVTMHRSEETARILTAESRGIEQHEVRAAGESVAGRSFVSCGKPLPEFAVRIVAPEQRTPCPPGSIGEIWISGPCVGRGYWGHPALSAETFNQAIGDDDSSSFLRTGDLGFVDDGELFITGRLKDVLIIHGRNLYPQDIEATAQAAHPSIRLGGAMAFDVERAGHNAVVLLVECTKRPPPEVLRSLIDDVRRAVSVVHEVDVAAVVPLRSGALPRTSSGKLQRSLGRTQYLRDELEDNALKTGDGDERSRSGEHARATDETEQRIGAIWTQLFGGDAASQTTDFFGAGGDSLLATQLISRVNAAFGLDLPIRAVFEAPSIGALAGLVRTRQTSTAPQQQSPRSIAEATRDQRPALSFSQERMWFMHALAPDSAAYNVSVAVRLRGELDVDALTAAFAAIAERHDILRTTFVSSELGRAPRVHPRLETVLTVSHLPPASGEAQVRERLAELAAVPFRLDRGPLFRAELLRLSAVDSLLLIVAHHIITDQWSFAVLGQELAYFYRMALAGDRPRTPSLELQYAQYATWHRQWFESHRRADELEYWRAQLAGLESTELHPDFPRPAQQGWRGAVVHVPLTAARIEALTALGSRHGASLSMVLIAALNVLLHRHTGRTDIAIGVPIANRHHLATEPLIGTFVNTLVFRTDLSGDPDFALLLKRVRAVSLDAFAHQDMPFELLVQELQLPRDTSRSPLFQVMFNMMNAPLAQLDLAGVQWSRIDFDKKAAQFDLSVTVDAAFERSISFEYCTDLFTLSTIERLADHYLRLLAAIADGDTSAISTLPLIGPDERDLLRRLSRGPEAAATAGTVTALLDAAAVEHSRSPAVTFETRSVSYAELHSLAGRLARQLRGRGMGRGSLVGICVPRSIEMLAAQLGILQTGAAYVPLDPGYPRERLTFMAQDAKIALLVTRTELADAIEWPRSDCLLLDALQPADERPLDPGASPSPADPAYVIYTSGSTGTPKGVVVPHGAVANFLTSMAREPGLGATDRLLAVTTLSFDIAVLELLLPLTCGAEIVLASDAQATDGAELAALIERRQVTVMQATPTRWQLLLDAGWAGTGTLKALVGGEPLSPVLAARLRHSCGELWNMYGPTETTVWSTCGRVEPPPGMPIDLGRPIAATDVYVLDAQRHECPIGVPGEIYIGGAGVASGYLNRAELTEQRFVTDPFAPQRASGGGTGKLYRTGDRGRWRHDGALEHLGRVDSQVKIRGYRIELGEIEEYLRRYPAVERAVVSTVEKQPNDVRLVAYIVRKENASLTQAELRSYLREWLPEYMVVQHFVELAEIPLLPNGKIDRRSLPAVEELRTAVPHTAPRTELERALWDIWRDVLQTERFGVHDDFFSLGGHSMLAVSVVARIQRELRIDCELAAIFRSPTIAGLCLALEQRGRQDGLSVVPLQPRGDALPLFCICGIHLYQELADCFDPDIPVYGIFVPNEVGFLSAAGAGAAATMSVNQLATAYVRGIRMRQRHGPYSVLGISFGGLVAYEVAQQLRALGEEVALLGILDCRLPPTGLRFALGNLVAAIGRLRRSAARLIGRQSRTTAAEVAEQESARNAFYRNAMLKYAPQSYPGETVLIQATNVPRHNSNYGWDAFVTNLHTYRIFDDHLGILRSPNVKALAEYLRPHLEKARRKGTN